MSTMGGYGLGFLPMIVSTAIAYSIADKPGIAPGLIVGFVATESIQVSLEGLLQVLWSGSLPYFFTKMSKYQNGWKA